jgi:cyclic pyranopterin phosphate synthase
MSDASTTGAQATEAREAATIRVDVRLFAGLREHAGTARAALVLPEGTTAGGAVAALWPALGVEAPGGADAMVLAVDREYAEADAVLHDGAELALIPPVSGGASGDEDGAAAGPGAPGAAGADDAEDDDAEDDDAQADGAVADDAEADGAVADDAVADGAVADGAVVDGAQADDQRADDEPLTGTRHARALPPGVVRAAVTAEPIDRTALHALVARHEAGAVVTFSGTPRDVPQLDYEAHEEMAAERIARVLGEVVAAHGACVAAAEHRVGAVPWPEAAVVVAVSAPHRGEAFAAAREALDRIKAEAPIWKQEVDGDRREWVPGTVPVVTPRGGTATTETPSHPAGAAAADEVAAGRGTGEGSATTPVAGAAAGAASADGGAGFVGAAGPLGSARSVGASGEPGERHPGGDLPHLRPDGAATMVDVGGKAVTERRAVAAALLSTTPETAARIAAGDLPKGDVLGVARIAGITAAKRVPDLVPLAHPLALTKVDVRAEVVAELGQVRIEAEARTVGQTGVEIEAMTAALVAAINVYDMVKGVERGIAVGPVALIAKSGGRTGDFAGPAPWDRGFRPGDGALAGRDAQAAPSPAQAVPGARDAPKPLDPPIRVGLLTVSTSRAAGPPDDPGSLALRELAAALQADVEVADRVPDDREAIAAAISRFADEEGCDLVITAGGTGCTVDDVTPEATLDVCDRQVPGIAEALRLESREHTHAWPLSRGVAAARGRTLVVNLPGSPKAAAEAVPVLGPVVAHAVRLLRR